MKEELAELKNTYREKEAQRTKQIALLEQKIELQKLQIQEHLDQVQMQKDLYDAMVQALKDNDDNSRPLQGQMQVAQKIYENNIEDLKRKHEANLQETVDAFTKRCENLYAYIKDAENLLEEMDAKRKRERKQIIQDHQKQISELETNYKAQINHLRKKVKGLKIQMDKVNPRKEDSSQDISRFSSQSRVNEVHVLKEELMSKDRMLEEANDQIVCLKSKLHGLKTIVHQLRNVEKKYNGLVTARKTEKQESVKSRKGSNIYIRDSSAEVRAMTFKKTRNSYVKSTRNKDLKPKQEKSKKSRRRNSKLKIHLKESPFEPCLVPKSAHNQTFTKIIPSKEITDAEKQIETSKHNLLERMSRIESIISYGKSQERCDDQNYNPHGQSYSYLAG